MKKLGVAALAGIALAALAWLLFKSPPAASDAQRQPVAIPQAAAIPRNDPRASPATTSGNRLDPPNALASYIHRPGVEGRNELDRIYTQGVPLTAQSVLAARALLQAGLSDDEKIALARILGRLYTADDRTEHNDEILHDLRRLARDDNREVARSAILAFSRLGYLHEGDALLKTAFDDRILGANDYYGELAHRAPLAPAGVQEGLLASIRASSNAYAADVLASAINENPGVLQGYTARSISEIRELLRQTEPRFASATGEFGLTDAVRYASWLRAIAQLDGLSNATSLDSAIVARLSVLGTDPRKITAYLLTPEAATVLAAAPLGSPARGLVSISNQYAAHYPDSQLLQSANREIASRIGKPKNNFQ